MALPKPKPGEPTATIYPGPLYQPVEVPLAYFRDMQPESQGGLSYDALCTKWYPPHKTDSTVKSQRQSPKKDESQVRHRPDCPTLKQAGKELVTAFTNFFSF